MSVDHLITLTGASYVHTAQDCSYALSPALVKESAILELALMFPPSVRDSIL